MRRRPLHVEGLGQPALRGRHRAALATMLGAELSGLDLVALIIDGVHFADHLCVVALSIAVDGTKHPLGLVEAGMAEAAKQFRPSTASCT